jgi:nitrogen fixation protein NifU and related proteins
MADLRELYQSVILDHSRSPRNFGPLADADAEATGNNPLCGDAVTVWVRMDGERIADVHFATPPGTGCAISKASASLMTTAVAGKTRAQADELFTAFHQLVTGQTAATEKLGRLAALGGVAQFPIRVKCATLAWHALRAALAQAAT